MSEAKHIQGANSARKYNIDILIIQTAYGTLKSKLLAQVKRLDSSTNCSVDSLSHQSSCSFDLSVHDGILFDSGSYKETKGIL